MMEWNSDKAPLVVFMGKTGSGKTTTINSLFGLDWPTDDAVACTRIVRTARVSKRDFPDLPVDEFIVMDTPGIAESTVADDAYLPLYIEAMAYADHIVWVFQADTRVFRPDQMALRRLVPFIRAGTTFLTIGLNHADQIGPSNWNRVEERPSPEQLANLEEKVANVVSKFSPYFPITISDVIAYSATTGYRLRELRRRIIQNMRGGC